MYSVLIIDDEEPSREAIRILGNWQKLGIGEISEAANGKEGIALIEQKKPDIVLVDMKMPEMDGSEFLKLMEQENPELLTIVISGYQDFAYTRQAIQSKAYDYLLKPVNRHDLNQALEKAINLLEEKRNQETQVINRNIALNMSLPKLKEKIFLSLIEKSGKQVRADYLEMVGAAGKNKRFGTVVFRMMNLDTVLQHKFHNDADSLNFAVANVMQELGGGGFQSFSFVNPKRGREIVTILTFSLATAEQIVYASASFARRATVKLKDLFGIIAVAGAGDACLDAILLGDSYTTAVAALHAVNLINGKSGAPTEKQAIAGRMNFLKHALETGDINYARSIIGEFLQTIKSAGCFSLEDALRTLHEMIFLLNDIALGAELPAEELLPARIESARAQGVSFDFTDFAEFAALLLRILDHYGHLIGQAASANSQFSICEIKEYIDSNYFTDIKISIFTEKYHLSREYLMKLFKQEFGRGIHEYVQSVRMDKAAELLKNPELKIQSISDMLGYKDKNYFSKAFKNYYSVSPSEYRTQRL